MKWRFSPIVLAGLLVCGVSTAKEGMWTPAQLLEIKDDLRAFGLKIDPAELADLERGPLAAVINLNGCTASFVSPDGLIVTNHHCAVSAIQRNSTDGTNRYELGFTAKDRASELWAGPSSRVLVTTKETDVTGKFREVVSKATSDTDVYTAIDRLKKTLVAECETDKRLRCQVAAYDGGARYVLIAQINIKDVRLVHAPPRAIGVFGGDIDNWMWPRHTGDWTLFRAYVGPDQTPAEHHKDNVPFKPARFLEVSARGVNDGGFVMTAGYPARTSRYRTAGELEYANASYYPRTVAFLTELLALVEGEQAKGDEAKVKLTSKRGWIANYHKYSKGLLDGFSRSGVVARKKAEERALRAWIGADADRKKRYSTPLADLDAAVLQARATAQKDTALWWLLRLPVGLRTAGTIHWLAGEREKPDAEREAGYQARDEARLQGSIENAFKSWHAASDAEILRFLLKQTAALPKGARITALDRWLKKRGGVDKAVNWLYAGMKLDDAKARKALFGARDRKAVLKSKDRFVALAAALYDERKALTTSEHATDGALARLRPQFMAALREYSSGAVYSDANATLRVSYAKVRGYSPREAVTYAPFTTLRGVLEKDQGKEPFDVPAAQKKAIEALHANPPAKPPAWMTDGTVVVNFLSGCDTTGGNSGSPTLDASGRLVGLLFDGNYEAMASDWAFDRVNTRSIHVDIRYLLWALNDVVGGEHLLKEMTLVQ